jgi:hypothetical protein
MAYTVKVREKFGSTRFQYIGEDLKVYRTRDRCKRLNREDAELAKRLLIEGAAKAGRPIECRIVKI